MRCCRSLDSTSLDLAALAADQEPDPYYRRCVKKRAQGSRFAFAVNTYGAVGASVDSDVPRPRRVVTARGAQVVGGVFLKQVRPS